MNDELLRHLTALGRRRQALQLTAQAELEAGRFACDGQLYPATVLTARETATERRLTRVMRMGCGGARPVRALRGLFEANRSNALQGVARDLAQRDWPTMDHYAHAKTDVIADIMSRAEAWARSSNWSVDRST